MSLSGTISSSIRDLYHQGEDEMYRGLSINCILYYPSIKTTCSNCNGQVIGGLPGNVLRHGIPAPVFAGGCIECGGTGFKESQQNEALAMQINTNPAKFIQQFKMVMLEQPGQYAQTKCLLTDMPKILQSVEAVFNSDLVALKEYRYIRASEPLPGGLFQDRYCYTLWRRNG